MAAIFLKELSHYFKSLIGYIFLSIQLLMCGFLFTTGNLFSQNADVKSFFSNVFTILVFLVPLLTMRQFSEERKMRTTQLLFVLPLSTEAIVIGKFLATLSVVGIGLAATIVYPLTLAFYGSSEPLVTVGNYAGIALLLSGVVAIGLFLSALSENQVVSAIISYAAILMLWLMDSLTAVINNESLKEILGMFSLRSNYIEFTFGIFDPAAFVFYAIVSVLFLFLTVAVLDSRRQ